jgi:uncharacterized protein YbjQ (UPF0145 family)
VLLSTLPDLPGRPFDVRGLVFASASLGSIGGGNVQKMVQTLVDQAGRLGADAIVDITTHMGGEGHCVMTGTAVRLLAPHQA